jgi:hypothetical protein
LLGLELGLIKNCHVIGYSKGERFDFFGHSSQPFSMNRLSYRKFWDKEGTKAICNTFSLPYELLLNERAFANKFLVYLGSPA